ncbi:MULTISPECIES: M48 family metallopeptidase [Methylosinus]|uniref:M48 family metallopeptidase n=1 Tax=Methylosinus sporium TaxID=428 RepID=A0A2U1SS98_METSR|nr:MULTISPECIES: SprT family zinc-dependent metalloprotease [Methylosinus]MBU3889836.1 M48 family metallopeptidase [Methylosinus sp. KRF6]PWB94499.1 metal-dependent hydrolase [Methylosinus sporium]TRL38229.1 M48 family metallopeptidase [Methylosinus sporium]
MLRLRRDGFAKTAGSTAITVTHAGETLTVSLRRLGSARRFTLRVRFAARDAVLTMPARASLREAREFTERHAAWISARLRRLPETIPFRDGAIVPLRGVDHSIAHRPGARGTVWIQTRFAEASSDIAGSELCVAGAQEHIHRRVTDFLKREARRDLEDAVERHTRALGLPARSVGLRDTVSRWGSCSATGSLNFSWRLIMAPAFVLDYLAAHEVAHLEYLDHSDRFWALTRRLCAETDRAEGWLSTHGAHLHKFGASE